MRQLKPELPFEPLQLFNLNSLTSLYGITGYIVKLEDIAKLHQVLNLYPLVNSSNGQSSLDSLTSKIA